MKTPKKKSLRNRILDEINASYVRGQTNKEDNDLLKAFLNSISTDRQWEAFVVCQWVDGFRVWKPRKELVSLKFSLHN